MNGYAVTLQDCKQVCPAGGLCGGAYDPKWCGECVDACTAAAQKGESELALEIANQKLIEAQRVAKATQSKQNPFKQKDCLIKCMVQPNFFENKCELNLSTTTANHEECEKIINCINARGNSNEKACASNCASQFPSSL